MIAMSMRGIMIFGVRSDRDDLDLDWFESLDVITLFPYTSEPAVRC